MREEGSSFGPAEGENALTGGSYGVDIDAEMARFEAQERRRLGLPVEEVGQWRETVHDRFDASQRDRTTILFGGLTLAHDAFAQAALRGRGYNVLALDVPDNDALQLGKEYGNRGQCNPTYFTVGNLLKYLHGLRAAGWCTDEIIDRHVFLTAGACGPCRFGTYVTEYRKALRDAGFAGFRVLLFQQTGGIKQTAGRSLGLPMDRAFFVAVLKAIIVGDVLNAFGYRIRPYEVESGATDRALERCKQLVVDALERRRSLAVALWKCRRALAAVQMDRTRIRPKVGIIGEFWAMTTEGDGNYRLQRFLESEGAEVDSQLVSAWLLYLLWACRYDTRKRARLRGIDAGRYGLERVNVRTRLATVRFAEVALRGLFQVVAKAVGLYRYRLPDMDELAEVSHAFYDNDLRGGEGHMEVGKLIMNIAQSKVNMTVSVKPFGCMPSSAVSDGVQSLVTELYPNGIFLPIETTGDGSANVLSRVQMQLFKAKAAAADEVEAALRESGVSIRDVRAYLARNPRLSHAFHRSPHRVGCACADLIYDVADRRRPWRERWMTTTRRRRWWSKAPSRPPLGATARTVAVRLKGAVQREGVSIPDGIGDPSGPKRSVLVQFNP